MERVSSCSIVGFSTTHRAVQGPVPSCPTRRQQRHDPQQLARRFHSYGDHLLASQALGDKVTVTAFSLATGEKSWQTDVPCAQECQVHDVAAMDESDA